MLLRSRGVRQHVAVEISREFGRVIAFPEYAFRKLRLAPQFISALRRRQRHELIEYRICIRPSIHDPTCAGGEDPFPQRTLGRYKRRTPGHPPLAERIAERFRPDSREQSHRDPVMIEQGLDLFALVGTMDGQHLVARLKSLVAVGIAYYDHAKGKASFPYPRDHALQVAGALFRSDRAKHADVSAFVDRQLEYVGECTCRFAGLESGPWWRDVHLDARIIFCQSVARPF